MSVTVVRCALSASDRLSRSGKEELGAEHSDALRVRAPCFARLSVALRSIAPRALRWSTE